MWELIRILIKNSTKILSFGRTDTFNEGLRFYKLGWATEEIRISDYRYDYAAGLSALNYRKPVWQKKVFKFMPLPLLKITGALLYKHVG